MSEDPLITDFDHEILCECVSLASEALDSGDEPFGSILVDGAGNRLYADRNRVADGDHTRHPEFAIARWAAANLTESERAESTVYTSGEHCPMCAAAHAWVGLGRIVYAASSEQLVQWHRAWGIDPAPVAPLPIQTVAPSTPVAGPDPKLTASIRKLHARLHHIAYGSDRGF